MFFVILLGAGLVAIGIASTFGGAWATVGTVVLMVIGFKLLFMTLMFGFFGRRFRAKRGRGWNPDEGSRHGPWPCGRHSETIKARMDTWHEIAHAGAETDAGASGHGDATAE